MSQFTNGRAKTFKTGSADLVQYTIVKFHTDGTVIAATVGTDGLIGVVENTAKVGDNASVVLRTAQGTMKVKLGGAVTAYFAAVTATTAGAAIVTTSTGDQILGYALELGASGDFIEIMPSTAKY